MDILADGKQIIQKVEAFCTSSGFPFPFLSDVQATKFEWPSPNELAAGLGLLSGVYSTHTLLSPRVSWDWVHSQEGVRPYKFYLDEASLTYPHKFYTGTTIWRLVKPILRRRITKLFVGYAELVDEDYQEEQLRKDVEGIVELELLIATKYSSEDGATAHNYL